MKYDMNIDVHHLTRVEGHGDIHIEVKDGKLVEARWAVIETPRFFEAMVRGLSHDLAPILTARICGICSIGHSLASLRAIERAMGVEVPETARKLRLLAKHGETLQSHVLHLFFLAAPDFFDVGSVLPIIKSHPDVAEVALRLKGLANDMCDLIAGRTTHPVSLAVGGLLKAPTKHQLRDLKATIEDRLPDMMTTVDLFLKLKMPDFVRETEFVSLKGEGLKGDNCYPWIGGQLVSTDGVLKEENDYLDMTNEYRVDFSTSKWTKLSRGSFAAGALARFNNNAAFLHPEAKEVAAAFGLRPVNHNPFMNNVAQVVESYHVMLESIEMISEMLDSPMDDIRAEYQVKAGAGAGAVEVPRGILYHYYELDDKGVVKKANCIIPTTQNNANIHYDIGEFVPHLLAQGKTDTEITKLSEMLVRSYDPCISCSVH
ncbi:MAG: Ni/Fe hydrogenase subunit alpha [Chlorobiales bacterium]|jgi:sulfhydrogenase subunit alpha|nr:Ni/Fe hydrogenase subunit alpha [Chlorobiales bacterium]